MADVEATRARIREAIRAEWGIDEGEESTEASELAEVVERALRPELERARRVESAARAIVSRVRVGVDRDPLVADLQAALAAAPATPGLIRTSREVPPDHAGTLYELIERAAAPAEEQGPADEHIIEFRDDGWTIMHPLSCRPNLFDCPVNRAAERDLAAPPKRLGRYSCAEVDGQFVIDRLQRPAALDEEATRA